ncbi:MAG: bifunctional adenosylcobinamide kinase/adenosylcobinamide-phosphate guanylyltransferase [Eubacteriales bacterium]|nr:bifunctional adenosylcobinamide kinase/adenosylcobinamide-phosphate guanylyltransferase [Eubacteriales bacterium]
MKKQNRNFELKLPEEIFRPHEMSLIIGGEKSGKSDFAEQAAFQLAQSMNQPLLYLATLYIGDDLENQERVRKHREQRSAYGFSNHEIYFDFKDQIVNLPSGHIILLDCLTNLLTNRLYRPVGDEWETSEDSDELIIDELLLALESLASTSSHLFIVANDLHRNLPVQSPEMQRFLRLHGKLLQAIAKRPGSNLFELNFGQADLIKASFSG